jgi:ankyrin repeat protein
MLVTAGADPTEHNEHGATPLHTAVSVLAEEVAEVLIAAGARLDAKSILVYEYNSRVRFVWGRMARLNEGRRRRWDDVDLARPGVALSLTHTHTRSHSTLHNNATQGVNWVGPGEGTPLSSPKSTGAPGSAGSNSGPGPSPRNRHEYRRRESSSSSEGEGGSGSGGEQRPFEDKTPLHLAVTTKNGLGMARFLLGKGADANATDAKGRTCLHLALERLMEVSPMGIPADTEACLALVRLLLEKGGDPLRPFPGTGGSCAHWCVQQGHVDALEMLLAHTFGLVRLQLLNGQEEKEGLTPLMLSARENKVGCLEMLLRNGAEGSEAARALAERQGHAAAMCILDTFSSFAGVA